MATRDQMESARSGSAVFRPCDEMVADRLHRYAVLDVDEDEQFEIERHLATCAQCRAVVDEQDDAFLDEPELYTPGQPSSELLPELAADLDGHDGRAPLADVASLQAPSLGRWLVFGGALAAAVVLAVLAISLWSQGDGPWTAEVADAELDPSKQAVNEIPCLVVDGPGCGKRALTFNGLPSRIPQPSFVHGFASASATLNRENQDMAARWQALVDKAQARAREAAAWGRWAALISLSKKPPAEAVTVEKLVEFADWAEPFVADRPDCTIRLRLVRSGEVSAVPDVARCLITDR